VLVETWLLLQRRLGEEAADRFWAAVRAGAATVEHVTAADLDASWAMGERFPDQSFSIVDRSSFAVMERLGVHRAIAFDNDFAVYRFGPRLEHAFELLR
jgi:predicted nucleic acid-binding protein